MTGVANLPEEPHGIAIVENGMGVQGGAALRDAGPPDAALRGTVDPGVLALGQTDFTPMVVAVGLAVDGTGEAAVGIGTMRT